MTTAREFADAIREVGRLFRTRTESVVRYGISGAIEIEKYYAEAAAIGVSEVTANVLLVEAREQAREWQWPFDPTKVARQQMRDQYVVQMPRAGEAFWQEALKVLQSGEEPFDPVDVERLARRLEYMPGRLDR